MFIYCHNFNLSHLLIKNDIVLTHKKLEFTTFDKNYNMTISPVYQSLFLAISILLWMSGCKKSEHLNQGKAGAELLVSIPNPSNDECSNAVLMLTNPIGSNSITSPGTTLDALQSLPACTGPATGDVWFSFEATHTSQSIDIQNVIAVLGTSTDLLLELFSGTCGQLTSLGCNTSNTMTVNSLTIGEIYYFRVYSNSVGSSQSFVVIIRTPLNLLNPSYNVTVNEYVYGAWGPNYSIYYPSVATFTENPDFSINATFAGIDHLYYFDSFSNNTYIFSNSTGSQNNAKFIKLDMNTGEATIQYQDGAMGGGKGYISNFQF